MTSFSVDSLLNESDLQLLFLKERANRHHKIQQNNTAKFTSINACAVRSI